MRPPVRSCCLLILALFGVAGNQAAADDASALFLIRQNGKFGYINESGDIAIEPRFLRIDFGEGRHFLGGLQTVWVGDKAGYIDSSGKMVIEPQFSLALPFHEGLAAVRSDSAPFQWGYINKTGSLVIPPQFDSAGPFSEGLAPVVLQGAMGYIDRIGTFVIEPQFRSYSGSSTFSEGLACVKIGDRWGFINKQGKVTIDAIFESPSSFHQGLAAVGTGDTTSFARYGYIDKSGSYAIAPKFFLAWSFSEGLARVNDRGTMSFIDTAGSNIFTVPNGSWAGQFSEGLVNIEVNSPQGKWGYVDRTGKWVIEPRFQRAEPFHNSLAQVAIDNRLAYIDRSGRFVWGPDSGNEALANKLNRLTLEEWKKEQDKLLHLARTLDPVNPPLRESPAGADRIEMETLSKLAISGSEPARQLLERLVSYNVSPALVERSPDLAALHQSQVQTQAAETLIRIGNPTVLPTLRRWLVEASQVNEHDLFTKTALMTALRGVHLFRDEASLTPLLALSKSRSLERWNRDAVFAALAEIGRPECKDVLLDALSDNQLPESVRCSAAAALVRLNENAGRAFLLELYDRYLDSLESAPDPSTGVLAQNWNSSVTPRCSHTSRRRRQQNPRVFRRITSTPCSIRCA